MTAFFLLIVLVVFIAAFYNYSKKNKKSNGAKTILRVQGNSAADVVTVATAISQNDFFRRAAVPPKYFGRFAVLFRHNKNKRRNRK